MSSRVLVCISWEQAPHLTPEACEQILQSLPPYQRLARSQGIPSLGAGIVYPIAHSALLIPDIPIPPHWKRAYGMDAGGGAKPTAVVWGAEDPDTKTVYLYSTYKREAHEPSIHAAAIKARGDWIPGVGDTAALLMTEHDTEQLIQTYKRLGLDLQLPDKAVETGIYDVWTLMAAGQLKIFASCTNLFEELRLYHRDEKGRIVKVNDHLCDGMRYLIRSGLKRAKAVPGPKAPPHAPVYDRGSRGGGWMRG